MSFNSPDRNALLRSLSFCHLFVRLLVNRGSFHLSRPLLTYMTDESLADENKCFGGIITYSRSFARLILPLSCLFPMFILVSGGTVKKWRTCCLAKYP